jgi:hypothetical protein
VNWAKGGSKAGRGGSFGNTLSYVLHDKDGVGIDRVGEVEMLNLATDEPARAAREMQTTVDAVAAIKKRNGIPQTGRKNERPVYAIALSWHPDDKPGAAHMMKTAREVITLLGLENHQAVIVEHKDRPHKHVHIVVNLVNPDTGRTAHLGLDEKKLGRWANDYELARNTIRSFARAAKFERANEVDRFKDFSKKAFELAGKQTKLREEIKEKKSGLSAKHEAAAQVRKEERDTPTETYKKKKEAIREKYQPLLDEIWHRKPKDPALELRPPGSRYLPEWVKVARAMLSTGMAVKREPLRRQFTRSLSKIAPGQVLGRLAQKFKEVHEGQVVMLPIRNTAAARHYAATHVGARLPNRQGRSDEIKQARNKELYAVSAEFARVKAEIIQKQTKERKLEVAEEKALKTEAKRAWADLRQETGQVREAQEAERQKNKEAFNDVAKDMEQNILTERGEREVVQLDLFKDIEKAPEEVEQTVELEKSETAIAHDMPDPRQLTPDQQKRADELQRSWESAVEYEQEAGLGI